LLCFYTYYRSKYNITYKIQYCYIKSLNLRLIANLKLMANLEFGNYPDAL